MSSSNNPSSSNTNESQKGETYQQPYTSDEKDWVKEQVGGEYKFLQQQGLSIHKEKDREEGRAIARGFMEADKQAGRKS